MPKIHVELDESLRDAIEKSAAKNHRSINSEVVVILEKALEMVQIPVVGKVNKDGSITLVNYYNTPEGIEQSR